ncbi:MAG: hypothetical protein ACP5N7_04055 [Candidatus Pacearchaeota archaeon]
MVLHAFLAQRIGDALGIARVNIDTIEKARGTLIEMFGEARVSEMMLAHKGQAEKLNEVMIKTQTLNTSVPQAESFVAKLFGMRDHFVSGKWNDKLALSKWLAFIEGAALTHWRVLHSVALQTTNSELMELAQRYIGFHQSMYDQNTSFMQRYASQL